MKADSVKIADGVYWVGALDWDARDFHGFTVPGMTYNAYLVFGDEKIALIDNVDAGFYGELKARIEDAFAKEGKDVKIDVYRQVMNNWDIFLDYVWSAKPIRRIRHNNRPEESVES